MCCVFWQKCTDVLKVFAAVIIRIRLTHLYIFEDSCVHVHSCVDLKSDNALFFVVLYRRKWVLCTNFFPSFMSFHSFVRSCFM